MDKEVDKLYENWTKFVSHLKKSIKEGRIVVSKEAEAGLNRNQTRTLASAFTLLSLLREGDLIMVQDCHHLEPHTYEVSRIDSQGPVSQPACFHHWWDDIIAVYRLTKSGKNYKCIWRKG